MPRMSQVVGSVSVSGGGTPNDIYSSRSSCARVGSCSLVPATTGGPHIVVSLLAGCTSAGTGAAAQKTSASSPSLNVSNSRGGTMTAGGATLVIPAGAVTGQVIAHLKISSTSVRTFRNVIRG